MSYYIDLMTDHIEPMLHDIGLMTANINFML
ncbi:MAG: hypothetical protein ACI9EQ_002259, partial [Bacteroidia bacterium]